MSLPLIMIATAVVALALGRLTAWPTIRSLRTQLADATWSMLHDPLTGMLNRAGLQDAHATLADTAPARPILVALIDLDDFKRINDTHGHDQGDDLLIHVGQRITDIAALHGGAAARLAGDEYAAILPARTGDVDRIADAIVTIISQPVALPANGSSPAPVTIAASVGLALVDTNDPFAEVALHRADVAMYHAKRNGRNRHAIYQPGMTMPPAQHRRGPRLRDRHQPTGEATA